MGWTSAQQAAIDVRDKNVLVSAAAGSGKTAVLTERVYQRVMNDRIDIDRFLIVTFTSAAAQEMKERIGDKLNHALEAIQLQETLSQEDEEQMAYIEKQLGLLPKASISTIHSFCLKVIRSYFHQLDIDPGFKVGNEPELAIMKSDLLEELLEACFEAPDNEAFLKLADQFGNVRSMDGLENVIIKTHTFSKSTVFPEVWLDDCVALLNKPYESLEDTPWTKVIKDELIGKVSGAGHLFGRALAIAKQSLGPYGYIETFEDDLKKLEGVEQCTGLQEMIETIEKISFGRLSTKKQECDPELKEKAKKYRDKGKEEIKKIKEKLALFTEAQFLEHIGYIGENMAELVRLIKLFDSRYQEAKRDKGIVDYSDQEHLALEVLIEKMTDQEIVYTDAARELSLFYEEVYIDEYQDSNIVQETLLSAIANAHETEGGTRFMVGDMKQSIYRFRLANPLLFANKYETWEKYEGPQTKGKDVVIDLSQNFRSRGNILEAANDVFDQMMSKAVGELVYDEDARLKVGNHYEEGELSGQEDLAGAIEVHLMETKTYEDEEIDDAIAEKNNIEIEAEMVATLIADLLGKGSRQVGSVTLGHNPTHIFDKEICAYRKVEPRDIVILLRSAKEKAIAFEQALLAKGIGAYADVSNSFFEALEVQTMMSLLQIIDNPLQDIPLLTILRSPIVGVSFDELAMIRMAKETGTYYEALKAYSEGEKATSKVKQFMALLENYREEAMHLTIEELLNRLLVDTGYYRYVSVLPTGPRKKANLRLLIKHAVSFESTSYTGLFNFIQYLEKLQQNSGDLAEAKLLGDNENLVRIMTIHKSKGLEFPIVFLSNASKTFNNLDLKESLVMHKDLGFGTKYMDTEKHVVYESIPALAIKSQIQAENISEEMRVLYVALTRPKEKLFVTGIVKDYEESLRKWALYGSREEKTILTQGVKGAQSYLNWIGMSLFASQTYDGLRAQIGEEVSYLYESVSDWQVRVWHKEDLSISKQEDDELRQIKREELRAWDSETVYSDYKDAIYERLSYCYPHLAATAMPAKVSVSDLKKDANEEDYESLYQSIQKTEQEPSFMLDVRGKQNALEATTKGTLIHTVLEHLDVTKCQDEEAVGMQLLELVRQHKVEEVAYELVNKKRLVNFAQSEVMGRMLKAKLAYKEQPFVYLVAANEVKETFDPDEEVLVQGVIDAFFVEEDGAVVIDYKTDYVDRSSQAQLSKSIEEIKRRYDKQLALYAKAITAITKVPVKQKYIYLYSADLWIELL
ncbi:MAG: helicase-exonuclease AddAB subunit AddA [Cellulosilyticaceae bacterium]